MAIKTPPINAPYLRDAVSQIDGSKFQNANCVLATTKMLLNASSLGFYDPATSYLRTLSGDTSGGVDYDTAIATAQKATRNEANLQRLYWAPENATTSTLRNLLRAQRTVGLSIDCSVTVNTPYHTATYTGGHTLTVAGKPFTDAYGVERAYVMDPGKGDAYVSWVAWPMKLLLRAAKARTGGDSIHVLFTRDLTSVSRVAAAAGPVRKGGSTASAIVGQIAKDQSYPVLTTYRSGFWTVPGTTRQARGWSQIGPGKYVAGSSLR